MAVRTVLAAAASQAWTRRSASTSKSRASGAEDSHAEPSSRPLLRLEVSSAQNYGATQNQERAESSSARNSPERLRRDSFLNRVPEEEVIPEPEEDDTENEDDDDDWEWEEQGFYRGSYKRLVILYTFVPFSSLLAFIFIAVLPVIAYPTQWKEPDTYPHSNYLPFPLPELLTSVSLWSLSHLSRMPLYSVSTFLTPAPTLAIFLSTSIHVILHNLLRLAALPILLIRHQMDYPYPTWRDPAFRRVWWLALGWSLAEVVVGIAQGYEQIGLYRDVMVLGSDEELAARMGGQQNPGKISGLNLRALWARDVEDDSNTNSNGTAQMNGGKWQQQFRFDAAIRSQVDRDVDNLMALKGREELEEVYGIPVIRIPVFVSCLLRIDSIILSLGLTLLLSASYLRSPISSDHATPASLHHSSYHRMSGSNRSFYITFPVVVLLHTFLSLLHTPLVLPRIGVHTAAYVGILIGLGSFFAGLGMWEAL